MAGTYAAKLAVKEGFGQTVNEGIGMVVGGEPGREEWTGPRNGWKKEPREEEMDRNDLTENGMIGWNMEGTRSEGMEGKDAPNEESRR